jgi:hypothetical protein
MPGVHQMGTGTPEAHLAGRHRPLRRAGVHKAQGLWHMTGRANQKWLPGGGDIEMEA